MTEKQKKILESVQNLLDGVLAIADRIQDEYSGAIKEITLTACNKLYDLQNELVNA
ncbi:MAG: hypothetical protein IKT93_02180 [Clostridia bacterium]|nr:hypothetical protein [Clostridia bacterium]